MKTTFTSYDVVCMVTELQRLIGMRVNQIYDIDNKTYLIRLQRTEEKCVLLLESGSRFHTTGFEWPKNVAPSGFSLKLRKHLKNKRLEKLEQLGVDRVVDFQFGTGEAAYHVILELYDRGNIILTDCEMTILNVLRPHVEGEKIRFAVREKYPLDRIKTETEAPTKEEIIKMFSKAKPGDKISAILTMYLDCGPTVVTHALTKYDLEYYQVEGNKELETVDSDLKKGGRNKKKNRNDKSDVKKMFETEKDMDALLQALRYIKDIMRKGKSELSKGYIVQNAVPKPGLEGKEEIFYNNVEYHPMIFSQNKNRLHKEFDNLDTAVDEYYSTLEGQKIDLKTIQQEKEAFKRLTNVKKDHAVRLEDLTKVQKFDAKKAELITRNQVLVDNAILVMRTMIANQMSWPDIKVMVKQAQENKDPIALNIKQLKLEINHISMYLTDPYATNESDSEEHLDGEDDDKLLPMTIDIDLGISAYANARKYHDQRRTAAKKEQKTIESSTKALKSVEKRTQQALKDVRTTANIQKARKVYWFEKFYWFISSENYLVIAGRDQQQNELIVKRYMRSTDIYLHADVQGAASVIVRNPTGEEVPIKTLLEAGTFAISFSIAWDAKVVTSAYWVKSDQVTKTAMTGEYLGTGSFVIRGKKNFLPPCHLILGLSFLFKLEESSVERHKGERRVRSFDDEDHQKLRNSVIENELLGAVKEEDEDQEIDLGESGESARQHRMKEF